uniref:Presenilin n=1 Tax=Micromonas pusilla TaxID=38833 RepID=A0A7S0DEF1_MICPS
MRGQRPLPPDETSVLDAVGGEIVAIVSPVSICMMCCVFLVRLLRVDGEDATANVRGGIASAAYQEESSDSTAVRAGGAVLNSVVFVLFITCATFGIFFLFKHNCTRLIWGYMGLSGLLIFGVLGAVIGMETCQALDIPLDMLTFSLWTYNFSVVGVGVTFFGKTFGAPLVVKQGFLIFIGVVVAFYFTRIPEWTTWTLLVAMALYDIVAVLAPGGPLRVLVELAQERDEEIPALVYEAAPAARGARRGGGGVLESVMASRAGPPRTAGAAAGAAGGSGTPDYGAADADAETKPLIRGGDRDRGADRDGDGDGAETSRVERDADDADDADAFALPDAIKLGLGDFIFYSVLVGRAAMHDLFTMFACYFAVIQGLIATLLMLGFAKKALPALPISIAAGVVAYVGSRFFLEPVTQQAAARLVVF